MNRELRNARPTNIRLAIAVLIAIGSQARTTAAEEQSRLPPKASVAFGEASEAPDFANEAEALETMVVEAPPYDPPMTLDEQARLKVHLNLSLNFGAFLSRNDVSIVLAPGRVPQRAANVGYSTTVLVNRDLTGAESPSLASALHRAPELSLNGRSRGHSMPMRDEYVLLRGLRATVLRDGVPLNDPFSGGVPWFALPRESLARAEVVAGGGATAWGDGALGGVVQFFTRPAMGRLITETKPKQSPDDPTEKRWVIHRTGTFVGQVGERDTFSAEFAVEEPMANGVLQILGNTFSTDGVHVVAREQRGPLDVPGWNRRHGLEARWRQPLSETFEYTATVGNHHGTPYQQERARRTFGSVAFVGSPSTRFAWNGVVYFDDSRLASALSLVNATREAESPWINQVEVPATAFGASWTGAWWAPDNNSRTTAGLDLRLVRGEARQHIDFLDGGFTRERVAGGNQGHLGLSLLRHQYLSQTWRASLGARLHTARDWNGHQRETNRLTGAELSEKQIPSGNEVEAAPSLGLVWMPHKSWRIHANAQRAFRRPTLAERFQTFGHAGIVTESNPDLRTETNTSYELGATFSLSSGFSLSATGFMNRLSNLVGDLGVTDTVRTRINIDTAQVDGVRVGFEVRPHKSVVVAASVLWGETTVDRLDLAPGLTGNQLARIPRRAAIVSATWQARKNLALSFRLTALGREFIDLENTRPLEPAVIADLGATFALSDRTSLFLTAANLSNEEIEYFRDANRVIHVTSPRAFFGGVRWKW